MKIAILKERRPHETRVAATPETVKKLKALGAEEVLIETGAGAAAAYTDQAYSEAGAIIVPDAAAAAAAGDVIFKIQRPMAAAEGVDELGLLRQGQVLMAPLGALTNSELVEALAAKGVTAFALELIPRITRAQSMDILCSQANLAGYKAVLARRQQLRPHLSADDDARRHAGAGARLHHGRGRGRAAGDRHGAPAGRRS